MSRQVIFAPSFRAASITTVHTYASKISSAAGAEPICGEFIRDAGLFQATRSRGRRSQRSGSACHGSERTAMNGCDHAAHIAMCSILYRNTPSRGLICGLGSSALDPKVGEKKWPLRKPRSAHTGFVRAWQRRASTAVVRTHRLQGQNALMGNVLSIR
jgi:hypothetical protein